MGISLKAYLISHLHIVDDNSNTPGVNFLVIGLHVPNFRSHVDRSTTDCVELFVTEDSTDAKVS